MMSIRKLFKIVWIKGLDIIGRLELLKRDYPVE